MGKPRVNVLLLDVALDEIAPKMPARGIPAKAL
jgi:hypothetical protein